MKKNSILTLVKMVKQTSSRTSTEGSAEGERNWVQHQDHKELSAKEKGRGEQMDVTKRAGKFFAKLIRQDFC